MPSVAEVSERFTTAYAELDPANGALMGIDLNHAHTRDYSPAGIAAQFDLVVRTEADLEAAPVEGESDRLGKAFLGQYLQGLRALVTAGELEREVSIIVGPPAVLRQSFDLVAPECPEDWDAIAARLEAVPAALAGYRSSLQLGIENGRPASQRCAMSVAEQCAAWAGDGDGGWFAQFASAHAQAPNGARLMAAALAADGAYGELAEYLRGPYAAAARETDGVGEDTYGVWAIHCLGGAIDTDEAYAWGFEELARLEKELVAEAARIDPEAPPGAVHELLTNDPGRAIDGVERWRAWLQERTDAAIAAVEGSSFDIAPGLRTCVVAIPPEGSAASPYYTSPSEDLSQPGRIWFPVMGRTRFATWDAVTTVYHEAVPGHHLQAAAARVAELTRFQKFGYSPAHGEGWALYAERLMDEFAMFELPEYRIGFLCMQLLRAARVVIDIGLHTGRRIPAGRPHAGERWNFAYAVEALAAASWLPEDVCTSEVLRYLSWPTQATSYKLGERAWLEGRAAARRAQGSAFDLKAWHAASLALGPLGLADLVTELGRLAG